MAYSIDKSIIFQKNARFACVCAFFVVPLSHIMAGIYIHIPFCKSRCKYCDFFSTTRLEQRTLYVQALLAEWRDRQHELREPITTIYLGGGTPSTLSIDSLRLLSNEITILHHPTQLEFTLEANPGDITPERVDAWRQLGINRLSIGVQSFDDNLLRLLGRRHTASQAREAIRTAQNAGFDNISIDLMYALPSQTMEQWRHDVAEVLRLGMQHVSCYGLIYEEGTAMTNLLATNQIQAVDEDTEMQMYDYLIEQLSTHGFEHYEVSNFALPGRHSRHNSSYWCDTPYLGLGAGAHSYDGHTRQWNICDLDLYIRQALSHQLQPEREVLSDEERHTERVMLGLRTSRGVSQQDIDMHRAQTLIESGLLTMRGDRICATTEGYHILNRLIEQLL